MLENILQFVLMCARVRKDGRARARVYILIVLHKITMTPLIKGKSNVVTAEVLHFLYDLHFPRIFLILLVRCIDHNSLRITNLFSGHTICFCALPIYFLRFFFLLVFFIPQNPISYRTIVLVQFVGNHHQCTAHVSAVEF